MSTSDIHEQVHTMTHVRHEDPTGLKVSREIPLPWLIGIVAAGFLQAALVYYKQDAQAEAIVKLTKEVQELKAVLNAKDLKDLEHDLKIADLQTRMADMQSRWASVEAQVRNVKK
ncbi:MAG: hypothetical protein RJB26_2247 [Pseudomonadota bacterium]|jgi:hypothetical protein